MRRVMNIAVSVTLLMILAMSDAMAVSRAFLRKKCHEISEKNPPQISIVYNYGQVSYDRSKTEAEMAKLYAGAVKAEKTGEFSSDYNIQGLTLLNYYEQVQFFGRYEMLSDNFLCYFPAKVEVRIGYKNPVVYLEKSLKDDSCEYKRVLRHEQTHLGLAHKALGLYAVILKNKIKDVIDETGVKVSKEVPDKVSQDFVKDYQLRLSALTELFKNVRRQQQQLIDSEENYQKESLICNPYRSAVDKAVKKISETFSL